MKLLFLVQRDQAKAKIAEKFLQYCVTVYKNLTDWFNLHITQYLALVDIHMFGV